MIVSDAHKYIFVGIPKTGSLLIRKALNEIEERDLLRDYKFYLPPGNKDTINHGTALQLRNYNPDEWKNYFKFVLVMVI
ncbi:MAG: hypothetical protein O4804_17505 [Trichodesmium sp. St11_bin5]|nr:hypothetical protein [Trichodesmium sp. St11_bin5]